MMSLIPPTIIVLPLVLIIIYLLNQRHERKIKDSFDELISPVKKDHLFDLPKAKKPSGPAAHEPYVPPSNGQAEVADDLAVNSQVNAEIKKAQKQLDRTAHQAPKAAQEQTQLPFDIDKEIKAEQAQKVAALKAKLAQVQAKKKQLNTRNNHDKIQDKSVIKTTVQSQPTTTNAYQTLKPNLTVSVKPKQ